MRIPDDARCTEDMRVAHNARQSTIEECARELEANYPDHAWLNAACAAIRAMKSAPLYTSSLPSGESDPSVMLDYGGADTPSVLTVGK